MEELLQQKQMLTAANNSGRKLLTIEAVLEKRLSSTKIEIYLDSGAGECWFRRPELAAVVADSLRAVQYILDNPEQAGLSEWRWVYGRSQ